MGILQDIMEHERKVAETFRYALPDVTPEEMKKIIDNNPALTDIDPCKGCRNECDDCEHNK